MLNFTRCKTNTVVRDPTLDCKKEKRMLILNVGNSGKETQTLLLESVNWYINTMKTNLALLSKAKYVYTL